MGSFSTTHISGTSFQILSVTVIISLYWRRFESLNQQHNNFSFNKELRMMMDSTAVRAPQLWRRPHAKYTATIRILVLIIILLCWNMYMPRIDKESFSRNQRREFHFRMERNWL